MAMWRKERSVGEYSTLRDDNGVLPYVKMFPSRQWEWGGGMLSWSGFNAFTHALLMRRGSNLRQQTQRVLFYSVSGTTCTALRHNLG